MTFARGLGWRKDAAGKDELGHQMLMRASKRRATQLLAKPSLREFRGTRRYQGAAGSCGAFALCRALQLFFAANGHEGVPFASPLDLYAKGRLEEWKGWDPADVPPLDDTGIQPRLLLQAAKEVGFLPQASYAYPEDQETLEDPVRMLDLVNQPPPMNAYVDSYSQRGLEWARIVEVGEARARAVESALRNRIPVTFGVQVDVDFLENAGEVIESVNQYELQGGHMITVLEVNAMGDIVFDNWWRSWGRDDGTGVMQRSLFGSKWVSDVLMLMSAPAMAVKP
jgi:hypothetical protein